ncbi:acyl-CoA/acyl-ACP dehydrogenase [Alphaproteobacteria bacterium]|jgi:alkylation response protein AidB-like acyl-CoA dehydrogenase|nr:acyl-CoA/acyl-ACP dehydrogenase [Alphaproteobacteria bacterium]
MDEFRKNKGDLVSDAPIFDPIDWRLSDFEAELCAETRELAANRFAERAPGIDRDARFPTENYADLHAHNLMGICIPAEYGGRGADLRAYMLAAAEIGRYCGATALTFNMHVSSCLWTGFLADHLDMDADKRAQHNDMRQRHYARILNEGAIYAQPFSEGGDAAAGKTAFGTTARVSDGGWIINGKKIFASLSGHANYYGVLCTELATPDSTPSRANTMYIAINSKADGVRVEGEWDPLGMRGTVSRTLIFEDVFVPFEEQLMPRGVYFHAAKQWPHMFMTLTPSYMGIAQAAYDFTVRYLRGEQSGTPPVKRRMYATKQLAVAEMKIKLEQTKSLWFQAITEARPNPSKDALLRAWAAQYSVMENANAIAQLAVRTCGGQAMLRSLPLERLYRDSRCGALMLPWTAELCTDMLGKGILYEAGESDDG